MITTEPIQTEKDLLQIVDIYRARWSIEEFFKALKSGCNFEKRGFEDLHALLNCLALWIPIACNLYNLKTLGKEPLQRRSDTVLNSTQIKILAQCTKYSEQHLQTLGPLMPAMASMGGHLKHNGPPGWQVLARGYEKLLQLEQGWILALRSEMIQRNM